MIIAYPSNDLAEGYSISQYLSNLRVMFDSVEAAGRIGYVTTTQPRNDISTPTRAGQLAAKDSIMLEFPGRALDFWDPLVDTATLGINLLLTADGIHPNNAGHRLLFQVVLNAGIFPVAPLPLTLTNFEAEVEQQHVLLQWTAFNTTPSTGAGYFEIQRSGDGTNFASIARVDEQGSGSYMNYSWSDNAPLAGKGFYRLKLDEPNSTRYSQVAAVDFPNRSPGIGKLYSPDGTSTLIAELNTPTSGLLQIAIIDAKGAPVLKQSYNAASSLVQIEINIFRLAAGQYFFRVLLPGGGMDTKAFFKP